MRMKMKALYQSVLILGLCSVVSATELTEGEIIDRARATIGSEESLDGVFTLQVVSSLEPPIPNVPEATLVMMARKPLQQRLEIRVDDIVETTILNGGRGCIVRSNLSADSSQIRGLVGSELERVVYSTQQFFNFYRPDFKNGETVKLEGIETYRDVRSYKLRYSYPNGFETVRYFSVEDDRLVATVSANGVESVGTGVQVVNGIKFPKVVDYYEGERKLHTITMVDIKVNKPLKPGVFDIPVGYSK